MGMDAWVFSRTKENYQKWLELRRKLEELRKEKNWKIEKKVLEYQTKYPDFKDENVTAEYVKEHFSDADRKEIKGFIEKVLESDEIQNTEMELNECYEGEHELNYWRKNYPVHNYIIQHFLEDGKEDNCEPIPLTKDGVREMVAVFKRELAKWKKDGDERKVEWFKPSECDYVSLDALMETIHFFENLVNDFSEDTVFYYYTWY
jgi:hypothetical protein